MFKFLRESATKASLANLNRNVEVLIIMSNRGSDQASIVNQLKDMMKDAVLAIENSKKTDRPISGEDIIEICDGLITRQGLEVGTARPALNAFYTEMKKIK